VQIGLIMVVSGKLL